MLRYLATSLVHLKAHDFAQMRHMRIRLLAVKGVKTKPVTEQRLDPSIVAALVLHELRTVQQAA